jgi:hypothetical protein
VWELLCSICIAFLCAFLAFWHGICNMMYRHPCILDCMHFVSYALIGKASPVYIVHHGMLFMSL